jgi:hypothetical protein
MGNDREEGLDQIKVIDRRRVSETGEMRPVPDRAVTGDGKVGTGPGSQNHSQSTNPSSASPGSAKAASSGATQKQPQPQVAEAQRSTSPKQESEAGTLDFADFVASLGTQTLIHLGHMPHPETRLVAKNLEAARQTIDILGMLEEKTRGNLSEYEEHMLEEVLANLRLAFVRSTGQR